MEIHQQMILRTHLRSPFVEIRYHLVVSVHEIYLEPLDSHLAVMSAYLLHIAVKSIIPRPQYQPHSTLLGIPYQHRQIYLFHHLEQIRFHVHSPSFVQYHIFNPVLRGKINIVLIRLVVNSRLEIHTLQVPVVPPVPRHLAGFNPTQVCHFSRLSKQITHIIHRQCRAILCHHGYTPRQRRFTFPPSLRLWI